MMKEKIPYAITYTNWDTTDVDYPVYKVDYPTYKRDRQDVYKACRGIDDRKVMTNIIIYEVQSVECVPDYDW